MKNEKYTYRKDCAYEVMITQHLVYLTANLELKVPNKRVCSSCLRDGGYGNKSSCTTIEIHFLIFVEVTVIIRMELTLN
jgi:hypothetical protein